MGLIEFENQYFRGSRGMKKKILDKTYTHNYHQMKNEDYGK